MSTISDKLVDQDGQVIYDCGGFVDLDEEDVAIDSDQATTSGDGTDEILTEYCDIEKEDDMDKDVNNV